MNSAAEKIILQFVLNEVKKNPKLLGSLVEHLLERLKVDPTVAEDIANVLGEILPLILADVKV